MGHFSCHERGTKNISLTARQEWNPWPPELAYTEVSITSSKKSILLTCEYINFSPLMNQSPRNVNSVRRFSNLIIIIPNRNSRLVTYEDGREGNVVPKSEFSIHFHSVKIHSAIHLAKSSAVFINWRAKIISIVSEFIEGARVKIIYLNWIIRLSQNSLF